MPYTFLPVSTDPVNVTPVTPEAPTSASPTGGPLRVKDMSPGGSFVLSASTSMHVEAGASSDGLRTMPLPKSTAGAILRVGVSTGKFQGVMAAITPQGRRVTMF